MTTTMMNSNDPQLSSSEQMLIANINYAFDTFSPIDEIQQLIDEVVNSGSMTRCNILFLSILNSNR